MGWQIGSSEDDLPAEIKVIDDELNEKRLAFIDMIVGNLEEKFPNLNHYSIAVGDLRDGVMIQIHSERSEVVVHGCTLSAKFLIDSNWVDLVILIEVYHEALTQKLRLV